MAALELIRHRTRFSVCWLIDCRTCAERDVNQLSTLPEQSVHSNPLYDSVSAMSEMGGSYREVALRVLHGGQHVPSPPPHTVPSPPDTQVISKVFYQGAIFGGLKGDNLSTILK